MRAAPTLAIVVPCYNEEAVLPETRRRLCALLDGLIAKQRIAEASSVYFVDDGSRDLTWHLIEGFAREDRHVRGIKLSRNRGHQNALLAGLFTAEGDAVITIDADLQDDVGAIGEMVERFGAGIDIVYGVRLKRTADTLFKRASADFFYRLMSALGAESVHDHADYRLMSRRAIESLKQYREVNLYLRGIVPLLGFPSEIVYYDRTQRLAGESKYPLRKMISLALNAITSFSVVPLRLITFTGFLMFAISLVISLWVIWIRFFSGGAAPGWASIVLPMYFLSGIQILSIGILGEYLGKVYAETKARPRFFIEKLAGSSARTLRQPEQWTANS